MSFLGDLWDKTTKIIGDAATSFVNTPGGLGSKIVNGVYAMIDSSRNYGKGDGNKNDDPALITTDPDDGHDSDVDLDNDQNNATTQTQGSESKNSQDGRNNASGAQSSIMAVNTSTESTIEQQSSSSAQNSVSQVLTAQSDANAGSSQAVSYSSTGPQVTVAPVMSVSLGDQYDTSADSTYDTDDHSQGLSWPTVAIVTAGASVLAYVWYKHKGDDDGN